VPLSTGCAPRAPDREERGTPAAFLRAGRITRRDDAYTICRGRTCVLFTSALFNGSARESAAFAPFRIIDGAGYRTACGP